MRRAQRARTGKPVRNLYTNPGSEAAGAATTIRTNLCANPSIETNTAGYAVNAGGGTAAGSQGTTGGWIGSNFYRATWSVASTTQPYLEYSRISGGFMTAGTVYSAAAYVRTSVATTIQAQIGWAQGATRLSTSAGSSVTVPANTWTLVTITNATAPANTDGAWFDWKAMTGTFGVNDTFDIDAVIIEASTVVGAYFDGATAAGGDFTYAWTSTANASTSVQKGLPVTSASMQNCFVIQSTDWFANGAQSARVIPGPTPSADTSFNLGISITKNGTYTILATCRVKAPQTGTLDASGRARTITVYRTGTGPQSSTQAPNAVGVYPLSLTFTVTDYTQFQSFRLYNGASAGNGDIWWDNIMLVEGTYPGDYINPAVTPYSKWDGAVNASTSVGYPPQLYDLAGKPFADLTGVGNTGGVQITVNALDARTIYLVYEATGTASNFGNYGSYGIGGTKGMYFQVGASGTTQMSLRMDFPTGDTNKGFTHSFGRVLGRHVLAMSFVQGMTSVKSSIDGGADVVTALNPGTGWDDARMGLASISDGSGIRVFSFNTEHSFATKQAISRYLGNKYGAGVA